MSRTPRTPLRSAVARLAITAAAGALVTAALALPAAADDDWGQDQGGDPAAARYDEGGGDGDRGQDQEGLGRDEGQEGLARNEGWEEGQDHGQDQDQGREQDQEQGRRNARGVVTVRELTLRSTPGRGGQVIRVVHRGEVVSIYCQTRGQSVEGNPVWYLLPDGTWAWGPARFIDVIGPAPRWC